MRRAEPRRLAVWPLLAAGLVAAPPAAAGGDAFAGGTAAMVVHDLRSGQVLRLGGERTALRLPPCSTFKVPNTLIALAAGAVDPEDSYLEWDPVRAPREAFWSDAWSQGQDLESAFRRSAVWYYQELARRVGGERMQRELEELGYGNRDISGGIDRFWLGSSLALSADEQVAVLRRIFGGETHFASEHVALLRQLMARREPEGVHWGHKTGACPAGDAWVGWLVGWVADDDGRLIALFAMNLEGPDHAAIAAPRIPLARRVLAEKGLLAPAEGPGR